MRECGGSALACSSVSDAEEPAEERRYRVRVCLQRFFSDERARCYVWVSGARRVRWLVRRLRRLFALPPALALVSRGYLLPLDEPLALLAPDDLVDVIPVARDQHTDHNYDAGDIELSGGDELDSTSNSAPVKRARLHESDAAVPHSPVHSGACSPASADQLCEMKRRALRLLDGVAGVAGAAPLHEPPRSRRRRVRRRRAPTDRPARPARPACPAPRSPRASPEPAQSLVRRNSGATSRAPRTVLALPDTDTLSAFTKR